MKPEDLLHFEAVAFKITLDRAYFDIDFGDPAQVAYASDEMSPADLQPSA